MDLSRLGNISLRTAHIAAMGVLLGGHWFGVERANLVPSLIACVVTGAALAGLETGGRTVWLHQGRGLMTLTKLGLLCAVPFCWDHRHLRIGILLAIVVFGSFGSHMPARFRYYSILYRQIVPSHNGPGTVALDADLTDEQRDDPPGDQQFT